MPHVYKKPLARNGNLVQLKKLGRSEMNYEWIQKLEKTENIKVKLTHVNKKALAKKQFFVPTPFSHSTLKLERKKITPQNHSLFRSISCFGVPKITTPI